MRKCVLCLMLAVLLCGCGAEQPTFEQTAVETETETVPETTEYREPDPVEALLASMGPEEKVGQLFLARCPEENAAVLAEQYHLGGYILFGRDFEDQTPDGIRQTIADWQEIAKIPMLVAVDEEGGTVCRVSSNPAFRPEPFPSPRSLYNQGGLELVGSLESEKAYLLRYLGINVNMAPVCDITTEPGNFMYQRSLGQSPEITGQFAADTVKRMAEYNLGSVLKHFPGYGSNADTHTDVIEDKRSLEQLEAADLVPFAAGIRAGCGAVLMSHNIVYALDPELPASLSPSVHGYLRYTMGFDGVIITDDLSMAAITELYGTEEAAVLAVLAGNDLLCTTDFTTQYNAVLAAVEDGRIPVETLDKAVTHVLKWKQQLKLI